MIRTCLCLILSVVLLGCKKDETFSGLDGCSSNDCLEYSIKGEVINASYPNKPLDIKEISVERKAGGKCLFACSQSLGSVTSDLNGQFVSKITLRNDFFTESNQDYIQFSLPEDEYIYLGGTGVKEGEISVSSYSDPEELQQLQFRAYAKATPVVKVTKLQGTPGNLLLAIKIPRDNRGYTLAVDSNQVIATRHITAYVNANCQIELKEDGVIKYSKFFPAFPEQTDTLFITY